MMKTHNNITIDGGETFVSKSEINNMDLDQFHTFLGFVENEKTLIKIRFFCEGEEPKKMMIDNLLFKL
jgi:hypothetical protein